MLTRKSMLKIFTISITLLLTTFILSLVICIVTHTNQHVLLTSIASREIQFAIKLSLLTSIISTLMCIMVSIPASYALARYNFSGKTLINTIVDLPLALPPLVAGVGLLLLFGTTPFGNWLADLGLKFVFTPLGIIIAQFAVNISFMLRIMRSTFEGISPRYEYVAQTLGCTPIQAFLRTTLPMSKNGLLAGGVITWSKGIGEFGAALMVAGATRMKTETLPISLYLNMSSGDLDLAIAAATILIIISIISLYIFEQRGGIVHLY
ncbi:MAG: molybdate transport system permease protein [Candidatus Methanocomedens sp.]|nr:MAG: molybdate transport system permease protein [ANME-2 cluster archaeon]